jgi:hypothetical protein
VFNPQIYGIYLAIKNFLLLKVTLKRTHCGFWVLTLALTNSNLYERNSIVRSCFTEQGGNYLNSACSFSDIATSLHVVFCVSLCRNMKQVAFPTLRQKITWINKLCRRSFSTISHYEVLVSQWEGKIFLPPL